MKTSLSAVYEKSTNFFLERFSKYKIDTAIILGSGLGDMLDSADILEILDTKDIPDYPLSTVKGHAGKVYIADIKGKKILAFSGRIHLYEGYTMAQCLIQVHFANLLQAKKIIITNAAGGINSGFLVGDLMLITGLYAGSLQTKIMEITGGFSEESVNLVRAFPDKELYSRLLFIGISENLYLQKGTYWYMSGPTYETPAEIQMIKRSGGDAVGMSSVHEILYALSLGITPVGISCITNLAAGISKVKLSHDEVKETAEMVKDKFSRFLYRALAEI